MTPRQPGDSPDPYMTPQQAADYLGVSIRSLYRWEDDGLINPHRTPGGHRRYRLADIEALLRRSA